MNVCHWFSGAVLFVLALVVVSPARAQVPVVAMKDLLGLTSDIAKRVTPQSGAEKQVVAAPSQDPAAPGLVITIQPGPAAYPGINLKPEAGNSWDLSAFGHVEARVINTGAKEALFALRVDNAGDWRDNPWNAEQVTLKPGERATVTVIFGHQYGRKPGYALKPKEVVNILMFTTKSDGVTSLRIESLVAGGPAGEKPPVDPASIRIKPANGVILGSGSKIDAATQIDAKGGAKGVVVPLADGGATLRIELPLSKGEQSVALKPPAGRWDFRDATEVRVRLKNTGTTSLTPSIQVTSNSGATDRVTTVPLAAGAAAEVVVPFAAAVPFKGVPVPKPGFHGAQKGTGTNFGSDATSAVQIAARHDGEATLLVESITAVASPAQLPDWLGKRPPVEGDWVKTFDENFDGPAIDMSKWNIYGPNYWDKATHWSKDNLLLDGGMATLRFEKKRGFHNDDPSPKDLQNLSKQKESNYACGFLETYGKFVQRYGYFEARVKLPKAPGLWPTFWLMPDRGPAAGAHDKRQDTSNGGMEFDIMEHLTRWGPYRYNIALHWDGYGKEHKSLGSATNYIQPDKDGFITSGLLWTPGSAIFYCNGKEMWRWEDPQVGSVPASILIEMTTGGWDNNAVDDTQLPADYLIDYVRVWQRKDLAAAAPAPELPQAWRAPWSQPPAEDRPLQIVHHLTLKLASTAGMQRYKDLGLGGIVTNVPFDHYMQSEENWRTLLGAVEACKQLGLVVWLYDEVGYPSGAADGLVLTGNRSFEAQELAYDRTQPDPFVIRPAYEHTHASNNYHAARRYANLLDDRAVGRFIDVTHEAYWKRLQPYFGSTIRAFFTDEPSLIAVNMGLLPEQARAKVKVSDALDPSVRALPCVPWSADLPEQYRKRFGQDLMAVRGSLFGGQTPQDRLVRSQFWALIGDLVADRYFGGLGRWCAAHGVASSGHTLAEESLIHHVPLEGNAIQALSQMHIPGLDMLSSDPQAVTHGAWLTAALPASAALLSGHRRVMTEVSDFSQMQGGKGPATLAQMQAVAAWQAAWGVTEFTLYYRPEDRSADDYRAYGAFVGRLNAILKPAAPDPQVLLYYPVCDLWPEYLPVGEPLGMGSQSPRAKQIVGSFLRLGQSLQSGQVPFALIDHENLAAAETSGAPALLKVAGRSYTTLVLPDGCQLPPKATAAVERFVAAGGRVLRDADATRLTMAALLEQIKPGCRLAPASDRVAMGRFTRDGRRVLLLVNVGAQAYEGRLSDLGGAAWLSLDPANGQVQMSNVDASGQLPILLAPCQTLLLVQQP